MPAYVAVDLGAESGRVVRGELRDGRLRIEETARFPNGAVKLDGRLRWDLPRLLAEVEGGLRAAAAAGEVESLGVDTWGVDFGLLGDSGDLLELPVSYRDPRTEGVMERFLDRVPASDVYARTGIQFLPFNTLYQLAALAGTPPLADARRLLLMPDLVHHRLCGSLVSELTNATTTQCLRHADRRWDETLLAAAGVDPGILPEVVPPATVLGELRPQVRERTGLGAAAVVAPGTHDTASAVAATPAGGDDWAYLSSGTWSLLGVETPAPVVTETARRLSFTNEGGVEGRSRLLRNVMGLWIVQRIRADLGLDLDYAGLESLADAAPPFVCLVDPDDRRFLNPPSMPEAIAAFCRETGQRPPATPGALVRAALESLALRYREVLSDVARLTGRDPRRLHVTGGGSRNGLLCRMTAEAAGRPVVAGPAEAAVVGNLLVQARALGHVGSLEEIREVARRSFPLVTYEPESPARWDDARERFERVCLARGED